MIPYIGGKNKMADWIVPFIPKDIDTYVEVFGGAYWVYCKSDIYRNPKLKRIVYNDFNKFMANLFACCRTPKEFSTYMKDIVSQDEKLFYEYQEKINNKPDFDIPNFEYALMYSYLATQVFSGSKIMNSKFQNFYGNDPENQQTDRKGNCKFDTFRNRLNDYVYQNRLESITNIENLDYSEVIPKYDSENTFFYIDPPYWKTENYYSNHEFDRSDHEKLCNIIKSVKGRFALSYYDFPLLGDWLPKDEYYWEAKNYSKCAAGTKGKTQNKGTEILIMNYPPYQLSLFDIEVGEKWTEQDKINSLKPTGRHTRLIITK